jgi:flagellar FliL protein
MTIKEKAMSLPKSSILIIVLVAVLVMMIGVGVYVTFFADAPVVIAFGQGQALQEEPEGVAPTKTTAQDGLPTFYPRPGQGIMYDVGPRIVNLMDPVGRRYLKVRIVVEFFPPEPGYYQLPDEERTVARDEFLASIDERKPLIDDMLTSLLTSKAYEDIYSLDGKNQLRSEIQNLLNQTMGGAQVMAVYFIDFVVQ